MKHLIIAALITFVALTTVSAEEIKSVTISLEEIEVIVGDSTLFTAVVTDITDAVVDTTVVWVVEGDIGTIDELGLFIATTANTGLVIAKLDDIADSVIVIVTETAEPAIVSIEVFPEKQTVSVEDSIQFNVEIKDSEGEDVEAEVIWSLSDSTIASIDEAGLLIALAEGETKVIASASEISGEAEVTVEEKIVIEPGVNTINVQRMKADGKITRFGGTAVEGGTINIGGIPSPLNFMNGTKIYFPENSLHEDITITFKLPKFGKIQDKDIVFPDSIMTAVTFEVSVNDTVISPYPFELPLEVSLPFKRGLLSKLGIEPEDLGMFYVTESGDLVEEGITDIYVDEENNKIRGIITHFSDIALAQKTDVITIAEGIKSISISPDSIAIIVGDSKLFTAVVTDSTDAVVDTTVVWVVEGDIGTIDENGLFFATSAGEGSVIAKLDAIADTALVTVAEAEVSVIESIEISPDEAEVSVGDSTQFSAVVRDNEDAEVDTNVVWEVEGDIGTIDELGLFIATTANTGLVIAKLDDIADSVIVIVTETAEPAIVSIEVFPEKQTVSVEDSIQFNVEIKDSEGEDVEAEVIWSLSDSTIASIDEAGLLIALAEGETKVIASASEISGEAEVTVEEKIVIEPGVNTINVQRMKADGKITRFGGTAVEGGTINIGGIPSPLNFMNGTKIYFPENSLHEDITITFKVPKFGKKQKIKGKEEIVFPDSIITAVTFEVSVNDSVISPYPFEVPLEVSMPFKRGLLSKLGIEPEDLGMFYVTESGDLVEKGITDIYVDEENNKIRGIITHFSDIALAQKTDVPTIAEKDDLPGGFSLSANYPNPFNPRTTISYSLPEASHVKITIYNLIGQHVKSLVNELKPVGTYYIVWDGTDASGISVTSGLYFYRIEAGNFNQTKKLMMMK